MSEAPANVVPLHGRVPPNSLDAEKSLLGGVLLDRLTDFDEIQLVVQAQDFYRDSHRKVFEAMRELAGKHEPVDRITVKDELVKMGVLEQVGGEEFLDLLDKFVPNTPNLGYYAKIIHEKAIARRFIETGSAIAVLGYEQHGDVNEYADECERRILDVRASMPTIAEATPTKIVLAEVFKDIEDRFQRDSTLTGAPSGLDALDDITLGFQEGYLVVIAARPSHGKTSLVLDTLRAIGSTGLGSSMIFEMEMPKKQLVERLLSSEGGVDSQRIRTGRLIAPDWERLAAAAGRIADMEIEIHDQPRTVMEIRALARRRAAKMAGTKQPLRLVAVDYLQRMKGNGAQNRDEELSVISRELKSLAVELSIPVLLVSSMNREVERRQHKRPMMSDLRECGALEFDADVIIFVNREDGKKEDTTDPAELIVGKNRNGPLGDAKVSFVRAFSSFRNIEESSSRRQTTMPLDKPPPAEEPEREQPPPPTERYP